MRTIDCFSDVKRFSSFYLISPIYNTTRSHIYNYHCHNLICEKTALDEEKSQDTQRHKVEAEKVE